MTHTIYLVDDNVFVREALIMLIEEEPNLAICGAAETAFEALDAILRVKPDLVLTDFSLPDMNGIELIERLAILRPVQRVAMLSAHTEPLYADRALAAGATGYILKQEAQAVIAGIRRVVDGEAFISPALRTRRPCLSENDS